MRSEETDPSMAAAFLYAEPQIAHAPGPWAGEPREALAAEESRALGYVELFRDPVLAQSLAHEALEAAQTTHTHQGLEAYAAVTLTLAQLLGDEPAQGVETLAQAETLAIRLGEPRADWLLSDARALALLHQGRPNDALVELIRLMLGSSESRPARDCYLSIASLARAHAALGHGEEALGSAYRALSVARRTGSISLRVHALSVLGARQLDLNNPERARVVLEQAVRGARRARSVRLQTASAADLIRTCAALGEPARALDIARTCLTDVDTAHLYPARHAEAWALAEMLNAHDAEALAWLEAAPDTQASLTRIWIRSRIDLNMGRPADALRRVQAWEPKLDETRPTVEAHAILLNLAAACAGVGDSHRAALYRGEADRMRIALDETSARAHSLSRQFEESLTEAQLLCCEMSESPIACT